MPTVDIPIANGFYLSESAPLSAQRCVNFYPNIPQGAALSPAALFPCPGIEQVATAGNFDFICRGSHVKNDIAYVVLGQKLYSLDRLVASDQSESYSLTELGDIAGDGRVSMSDNGTQLMILVPGGNGYIYNEDAGTPFEKITDLDFTANGNPQIVDYVDGYFVCSTDDKKWIISAINDGLSWSALDFGTAESDPDGIVAPIVFRNQLFILGAETTEAFINQPNGAGFPFIRANTFMQKGCFAPFSVVKSSQTFAFIGGSVNESPAIWAYSGGDFGKISTTAIDNLLANASDNDLRRAVGFAYAEKGAYFMGFTFGNNTLVYDAVTRLWHERSSFFNDTDNEWRANSLFSAYGRIFTGDSQDGRVGLVSRDLYCEYGEEIRRFLTTQPFSKMGKDLKVSMVELIVEAGVGDSGTPDPQVSMSISDDAKTFKYERRRSMGKVGEYKKRCLWYRNGSTPHFRIFKFLASDKVPVNFLGARMSYA